MAVLATRAMGDAHDEHKTLHPFFGKVARPSPVPSRAPDLPSIATPPSAEYIRSSSGEARCSSPSGKGAEEHNSAAIVLEPAICTKAFNTVMTTGSHPELPNLQLDMQPSSHQRKRPLQQFTSESLQPELIQTGQFRRVPEPSTSAPTSIQEKLEVASTVPGEYYGPAAPEAAFENLVNHPPAIDESTMVGMVGMVEIGQGTDFPQGNGIETSTQMENQGNLESNFEAHSAEADTQSILSRQKKILHFNTKTGTIGSPPAKRTKRSVENAPSKTASTKRRNQPKSLIVKLKYGHDLTSRSRITEKIDKILQKNEELVVMRQPSPKPVKKQTKTVPTKSTHPFFLGKVTAKSTMPDPAQIEDAYPSVKTSLVKPAFTSVSGRRENPFQIASSAPSIVGPRSFLGATKMPKFAGAIEPIWPPADMMHVRGIERLTLPMRHKDASQIQISSTKKAKYTSPNILVEENILDTLAKGLNISKVIKDIRSVDTEKFPEPETSLRLPEKNFESGFELQKRIRNELASYLPPPKPFDGCDINEDDRRGDDSHLRSPHPALKKVYDSIPSSLTAFDRSEYETQSWIHKYSPKSAAEVLQNGRDAYILKEWLQSLTIIAVETGAGEVPSSRATSVASKRSSTGKRKRKSKKLDGFIVSSDDEEGDMDEISEPEDDLSLRGSQGLLKKTVIRAGDVAAKGSKDSRRLMNAVVISGPSGCGKTAAVYAVAKELGFEVFEINSSSRRSGKDIMERVGDMTRNHLVQRMQDPDSACHSEDDNQRLSEALEADLKSGRQGTMNSFFKPNKDTNKTPTTKPKKERHNDTELSKPISLKTKTPAQQKQSLILLEEVDILFEEDKQFWTTVMTLIEQSKRPVIMTCNDETVVPLQALSLHAIIRLGPPPRDLAVDYMLLVAANEGHVLQRKAVKSLYETQKYDLRASMTELDFWCQIGVGDRRGGLEWFYPRLPIGVDRDSQGNTIRVISEGTYQTGMGWLGRDYLLDIEDEGLPDDKILHELWDGWQIDADDWSEISNIPWESPGDRLAMLKLYEYFSDTQSVADIAAHGGVAAGNEVLLDTTTPDMSMRGREDYIIGNELLQADLNVSHDPLAINLSFWIKSNLQGFARTELSQVFSESLIYSQAGIESCLISKIITSRTEQEHAITRHDYSNAFDPIATPERTILYGTSSLEASCLDRTMSIIATDIAPYVRSVVSFDIYLQQERAKLSNLLSEGGRPGKRMRTTRSALSALEGGTRKTTRRERWFGDVVNPQLVLRTGHSTWLDAVRTLANASMEEIEAEKVDEVESEAGSPAESNES